MASSFRNSKEHTSSNGCCLEKNKKEEREKINKIDFKTQF